MARAKREDLYERELARFRETLRLDHGVAMERYGMTLIHSLNPAEKALALKEMGNELTDAVDFYNLGVMRAEEQNWDEAINLFRHALEVDGALTDAIYNLAVCYEKANLIPQAKATWQSFLSASSNEEERALIKDHLANL